MTERRTSTIGRLAAAGGVALALACFAVAGLLSSGPRLPPTHAPGADEVRRAREAVLELALALSADGTPRPVRFAERDLEAAAALANHGFHWLRISPTIEAGTLAAAADLRIAPATWLPLEARAVPNGAFPDISLRAGAWRLPPFATRLALRAADAFARWRDYDLPPIDTMVRGFHVGDRTVEATLAVPRRLFHVARDLAGTARPTVDPALLRTAYERLRQGHAARPDTSLAAHLRRLFAAPPPGADAVEYNRAALVALAVFAVDPRARRLGGEAAFEAIPAPIVPPELHLGGRPDLAKHFVLSAAMAVAVDPRFTRAIGEWKELDDSLPGGSGFSFVDLTADRAGLHLGRAAIDPAMAGTVAGRLAEATDAALFPAAARKLDEGLSDTEFRRRYRGIEATSYAAKVGRVDGMLADLPLYAPLVGGAPTGLARAGVP